MFAKLAALTAFTLSLAVVAPVSAQERSIETRTVVELPTALTDARSVEKAYMRLKIAARSGCDSGLTRDVKAKASDRACAAAALDEAVRASNLPELVAYHDDKTADAAIYADNSDAVTAQR